MLVTNKRVMIWLCMCPAGESFGAGQKMLHVVIALVVFGFNASFAASSVAFIWSSWHTDFSGSLFASMLFFALGSIACIMVIASNMRYEIAEIFSTLSTIYNACKSTELLRLLTQANFTCEWIWLLYVKVNAIVVFIMALPIFASCVCRLANLDCNDDDLWRFVLPWNQSGNLGFLSELIFGTLSCISMITGNGAVMLLFISICIHHQTFYEMFQYSVNKLDRCKRAQHAEEIICDLIRFRIFVQDWFVHSAKVYSPFILVELISSAFTQSVVLLNLEIELRDPDYVMSVIIGLTGISMSILYFYCFFGAKATESFESMSDSLYESNWPDLPIALQKYLLMIITNMQRPIDYHGYHVFNLNLKTFISLIRKVLSYYMAFRTLTS